MTRYWPANMSDHNRSARIQLVTGLACVSAAQSDDGGGSGWLQVTALGLQRAAHAQSPPPTSHISNESPPQHWKRRTMKVYPYQRRDAAVQNLPHRDGAVVTNVATTASTLPDSKALEGIHQSQQRRGLLPDEHYLDSGYPSAELITGSLARYGVALITPVLLDTSRQAKAKEGFAACDFTIDWQAGQAICPAGKTSATWNPVA